MQCEQCGNTHDGTYGSGRFCCQSCARKYANTERLPKNCECVLTVSTPTEYGIALIAENCWTIELQVDIVDCVFDTIRVLMNLLGLKFLRQIKVETDGIFAGIRYRLASSTG